MGHGSLRLSDPDIFKNWLQFAAWSGTAGFAIVVVAAGRWLAAKIEQWLAKRAERRTDAKNAMANLETLTPQEEEALYVILDSQNDRFDVPDHSPVYYPLIRKKILVLVDYSVGRSLCELHPAICKNREKISARLRKGGPELAESASTRHGHKATDAGGTTAHQNDDPANQIGDSAARAAARGA
jgi:hypothetical protein